MDQHGSRGRMVRVRGENSLRAATGGGAIATGKLGKGKVGLCLRIVGTEGKSLRPLLAGVIDSAGAEMRGANVADDSIARVGRKGSRLLEEVRELPDGGACLAVAQQLAER